jgi:hypothetical protein
MGRRPIVRQFLVHPVKLTHDVVDDVAGLEIIE